MDPVSVSSDEYDDDAAFALNLTIRLLQLLGSRLTLSTSAITTRSPSLIPFRRLFLMPHLTSRSIASGSPRTLCLPSPRSHLNRPHPPRMHRRPSVRSSFLLVIWLTLSLVQSPRHPGSLFMTWNAGLRCCCPQWHSPSPGLSPQPPATPLSTHSISPAIPCVPVPDPLPVPFTRCRPLLPVQEATSRPGPTFCPWWPVMRPVLRRRHHRHSSHPIPTAVQASPPSPSGANPSHTAPPCTHIRAWPALLRGALTPISFYILVPGPTKTDWCRVGTARSGPKPSSGRLREMSSPLLPPHHHAGPVPFPLTFLSQSSPPTHLLLHDHEHPLPRLPSLHPCHHTKNSGTHPDYLYIFPPPQQTRPLPALTVPKPTVHLPAPSNELAPTRTVQPVAQSLATGRVPS